MKMDKELLIKHRFWALLAFVVPLLFLALIVLGAGAGGAISAKQKAIKDTEAKLKTVQVPPKNPTWVAGLDERGKAADLKKKDIWQSAWKSQESLFTWPSRLQMLQSRNFGDPIDVATCDIYRLDDVYLPQVQAMVNQVDPVRDGGKAGAVQFKDGWQNVIRWVRDNKWTDRPTPEDVWLAQEDVWMQRGLLQAVREANDSVGVFRKEATGARPAAGELDRQTFTNPDWKMELALARDPKVPGGFSLKIDLTNLSSLQQVLGMSFRVFLNGAVEPEELLAEGEPLGPGATWHTEKPVKALRPQGVDRVEQVFDWRSVPVKRVDRIALGQQSHRTAGQPLVKDPVFEPKKEEGTPNPNPNPNPTPPGGETAAAGGNQPKAPTDVTPNGLVRNRYSEINPAVRRLPVAIVLVVDESYIQNVLTALANSRLRIQTTQVEWQHFPRGMSIKPPATAPVAPAAPAVGAAPPPATGAKSGAEAGTDDVSGNCVQLVVYGVASLYERYPPPAPPAEANNPANPAPK